MVPLEANTPESDSTQGLALAVSLPPQASRRKWVSSGWTPGSGQKGSDATHASMPTSVEVSSNTPSPPTSTTTPSARNIDTSPSELPSIGT